MEPLFFYYLYYVFSLAFIFNNVREAKSFRKQYTQAAIQGQAQHLAVVHIAAPAPISSPASSNVHRGCGRWKSSMDGGNNQAQHRFLWSSSAGFPMNYLGREGAGLGALVGQWGQSPLSQAAVSHVVPGVQSSPPNTKFHSCLQCSSCKVSGEALSSSD